MLRHDWEVIVTFRNQVVERHTDLTRRGAQMMACGLNSTFARGMVRRRGGLFTAPTYEGAYAHASARLVGSQ